MCPKEFNEIGYHHHEKRCFVTQTDKTTHQKWAGNI